MKLGVVGSRNFNDYTLMKKYLDKIHTVEPITCIVSGGAQGADKLSEKWAKEYNIGTKIFIPDWKRFNKAAGYIRNADIVKEADKIIAFWNGKSKGTKHTIDICKKEGKKCKIVYTDKDFIRAIKIKEIMNQLEKRRFRLDI